MGAKDGLYHLILWGLEGSNREVCPSHLSFPEGAAGKWIEKLCVKGAPALTPYPCIATPLTTKLYIQQEISQFFSCTLDHDFVFFRKLITSQRKASVKLEVICRPHGTPT